MTVLIAGLSHSQAPSATPPTWVSSNPYATQGFYGSLDFGFGTAGVPAAGTLLIARAYSAYNDMIMSSAGGQTWTALPTAGVATGQTWWAIFNGTLGFLEFTDPSYQGSHAWFGDLSVFSGNHPTAPIDGTAVGNGSLGTGGSTNIPTLTTTYSNSLRVALLGASYGFSSIDGPPGAMTQRYYYTDTNSGVAYTDLMADTVQAVAGVSAAEAFSVNHGTSWACTHIGIRAA